MTLTNIQRIFREKPNTKFKDKYGGATFTVKELNDGFLRPSMAITKDPESKEWKELDDFFERYEKVGWGI